MELNQFKGQDKAELAMVDVAHAILQTTGEVKDFNDLLSEVADYLGLSDAQLEEDMVQFYTDLNVDGRFISLGDNRWGLRSWYPIDAIDEEITHDNDEEDEKPRRRKKRHGFDDEDYDDEDLDDEELEDDEEEEDDDDEPIEYGDRVAVDEHGVMVDDEDDEDLGEYKDDLEDLDDVEDDEDLKGLNIVDDEEVLDDDEEDDEE
ncbi:DNA-directed RNA polymerase subunit delta [Alkalibacterium subtropicum]|uniref:Probable DNA-directed RNA polymerase subunit delta n=1 Tax=Alkalibacterium subtropicum TaxID=753702 RepID=A0A1I1LK02_9LACT|nr:DNA-directed RNA polymerase subunit delta [Alkalibacterium subtropicum]SFC73444.1 DNA-directed RNA polymerase subunit delta [Alkalibacterium subtropicum]